MAVVKSKAVQGIEEKMGTIEEGSLRYQILECAKNFKTSWINLGQALYSVWKDKRYKEWGYASFDTYTAREIGIRKNTAMKLLRSYYFLEKEEPAYLRPEHQESSQVATLPNYESIDVLRLAKHHKELDEDDYANLKKEIFQKGKTPQEVRKDLTTLIRQRRELEPEEAWEKRKITTVKRLVGVLKTLTREIEIEKLLPTTLIKETAALIKKLEAEIS